MAATSGSGSASESALAPALASAPTPADRLRVLPYIALVVGIPAATVVAGLFTWQIAAGGGETIAPEPAIKRGLVIEDPRARKADAGTDRR